MFQSKIKESRLQRRSARTNPPARNVRRGYERWKGRLVVPARRLAAAWFPDGFTATFCNITLVLCAFWALMRRHDETAVYFAAAFPIMAAISLTGSSRKAASYCRYSSRNQNERTIEDQ